MMARFFYELFWWIRKNFVSLLHERDEVER